MLQYHKGKPVREGLGLSFFCYSPATSPVAVPVAKTYAPLTFEKSTADFQTVTLHGQVTFRVANPKKLASLMNLTLNASGDRHFSEDPNDRPQRLINMVNML